MLSSLKPVNTNQQTERAVKKSYDFNRSFLWDQNEKRYIFCIALILTVALSWRYRGICDNINANRYCKSYTIPTLERKIQVCSGFIPNGFSIDLAYRATLSIFDLDKNLLGFYDLGEEYFDGIAHNGDPNMSDDGKTFNLGLLAQQEEFDTTPWFHRRLEAKAIQAICRKQNRVQ